MIFYKALFTVLKLKPFFRHELFTDDYNSHLDPRITNEFASAGFRVGHTMVARNVE